MRKIVVEGNAGFPESERACRNCRAETVRGKIPACSQRVEISLVYAAAPVDRISRSRLARML
jgi:hypothetical protein